MLSHGAFDSKLRRSSQPIEDAGEEIARFPIDAGGFAFTRAGDADDTLLTAREQTRHGTVDIAASVEIDNENGPAKRMRMKPDDVRAVDADFRRSVENAAESFALVATTEDCQEGLNAFVEKRTPNYRGR